MYQVLNNYKIVYQVFTAGFEVTGDISGSATSTGSFTRVVANTYVGSGDLNYLIHQQLLVNKWFRSNCYTSQWCFTSGFITTKTATISGSGTSTGSFGTSFIWSNS